MLPASEGRVVSSDVGEPRKWSALSPRDERAPWSNSKSGSAIQLYFRALMSSEEEGDKIRTASGGKTMAGQEQPFNSAL